MDIVIQEDDVHEVHGEVVVGETVEASADDETTGLGCGIMQMVEKPKEYLEVGKAAKAR
ncbi:hypothetical protein COLO4_38388 [Corchorus olitorius]|uniref:Uncharacterized protein n=1 Tax=Corchorus olitorius TaxID=93759 RepID=A0A1R3FVB6_9ROSI|nr:hypothetical protein COLO4_38388 [Corchorus olitorius]